LLPFLELVCNTKQAVDELIDVAGKGQQKLQKLSQWLRRQYPSEADSLLEGLGEMFTIDALDLPKNAP